MLFDLDDDLDPFICNFFDLMSEEEEDESQISGKRKYSDDDEVGEEEINQEFQGIEPFTSSQGNYLTSRTPVTTSSSTKPHRKPVKIGYSGTNLAKELMKDMKSNNDSLCERAIQVLGELIYLHKSDDARRFIYGFNLPSSHSAMPPLDLHDTKTPSLTLTIIRGSILTTLFSSIARFEDEYLLELKGLHQRNDGSGNLTETNLLWSMKGYLHENTHQHVETSELDWVKMKHLQDLLQINEIGVHSFAKILSKYVLCLPLHEREGQRYDPMPATVM
jgi:hypothetical protein